MVHELIKILKSREDKVCPLLENYLKTESVDDECLDQFNSTLASKIGQLLKIESRRDVLDVNHDNTRVLCNLIDGLAMNEEINCILGRSNVVRNFCELMEKYVEYAVNQWTVEETPTSLRARRLWDTTLSRMMTALNTLSNTENERNKVATGELVLLSLVDIVKENRFSITVRRQGSEIINTLIKKCKANKELIYNLESGDVTHVKELASGLINAGDYGIQANITEALYRIALSQPFSEEKITAIFDSFDDREKIIVSFQSIRGDPHFLDDIHRFVMVANQALKKTKRCTVLSLPCKRLSIGTYVCDPSWIDFGVRGLSFFATVPEAEESDAKSIVDLHYERIRTLKLAHKTSSINIQLNSSLNEYKDYYNADDDEQFIRIEMDKDDLLVLKNEIAPMIQTCRDEVVSKEELIQKASASPKISVSIVNLQTSNDMNEAHTVVREMIPTTKEATLFNSSETDTDTTMVEPKSTRSKENKLAPAKEKTPKAAEPEPEPAKEHIERQTKKTSISDEEREQDSDYEPPKTRSKRATKKPSTVAQSKAPKTKKTKTTSAKKTKEVDTSKIDPEEKTASSGKKKKAAGPAVEQQEDDDMEVVGESIIDDWNQVKTPKSRVMPKVLDHPEVSGYDDSDVEEHAVARSLFISPKTTSMLSLNTLTTLAKRGSKRKVKDAESDNEFMETMVELVHNRHKKKMDNKKRRVQEISEETSQRVTSKIHAAMESFGRDKETLFNTLQQEWKSLQKGIHSLSNRMKKTHSNYQQELVAQVQEQIELSNQIDALHSSFNKSIFTLSKKEKKAHAELEQLVAKDLADMENDIKAIEREMTTPDDLASKLRQAISALDI